MGSTPDRSGKQPEQAEPVGAVAPVAASAPPGLAALRSGGLSVASVLALQRSAGNQAAGRIVAGSAPRSIQRDLLGDIGNAIGDAFDARDNEEELDAHEELEDFRDETYDPLEDYAPTSGVGLFDAACDMRGGTLTITLKVAYNFTAGDPTKVSAGFRAAEFQWTPAEQAEWKARYMREVGAMWSAQFVVSNTKPHWEAMTVATTVSVIEDAADPHFTLTVAKYPPDAGMVQSSICPPGFHHNAATGNCSANTAADDESGTGELDSNDLRPEQKLDWGNATAAIPFTKGSSALGPAGTAALAPIITAVAGVAGAHVEITGHASNTHRAGRTADEGAIDNMDLARQRSAAVQAALIAGGATADQVLVRNVGEANAGAGDEWCRVDAQVGTQQMQNPGLHETGHMLGSDDEYPQTGAGAGTPVAAKYDAMIQAQTGDVITRARNADAMSVGSTVRRWNYAAFLEALEAMTGETEWTL